MPWTVEALRARSARVMPMAPKPVPATAPMRTTTSAPATPPSMWAPKIRPSAMNQSTCRHDSAATASSRPATIAVRGIGDAARRSKKPPSISSAMAIPDETPPSSSDCVIAAASWKSRKPCTCGKPGRSVVRCRPPTLTARNSVGKATSGMTNCGRRKVLRSARRASARLARVIASRRGLLGAFEVAAGLLHEDVVERRLHEVQRGDRQVGGVERADDRRDLRGAVLQRDRQVAAVGGRAVVAELHGDLASALEVGVLTEERQVEVRAADLRLQRRRRALGHDQAVADDADAVGELVGLLEVLRGQEDRLSGPPAGPGAPPPRGGG